MDVTDPGRRHRRREVRSPLSPVTAVQVAAHNFLRRRDEAAITENEVDMVFTTGQFETGSLVFGGVFTAVICAVAIALAMIRPIGRVDQSRIVADADHHTVYVLLDGVLHPAWNLVSAQLAVGQPTRPASVKASVLAKYPTGARVGIVDAPPALIVHNNGESRWSVCDTAPAASSDPTPTVTALAGRLEVGERATALSADTAVLAEHAGAMYAVWGSHRSLIDLANRSLALALGIDSSAVKPVRLSNAVFDALPATEALTTPSIAQAGSPSRWDLGSPAVVGSILKSTDLAGGTDQLYVLLADGVQRVEPFVAALVMSDSARGQVAPLPVSAKALASVPASSSLRTDFYPPRRLHLVDTRAFPVLCVSWSKGVGEREAVTSVISGKVLPVPAGGQITQLVRDDRRPNSVEADQVWVDPAASNLAVVTNSAPSATSRESLWWVSPQGIRYGIDQDQQTLRALDITPAAQAVQAPWPLIRVYGKGPTLNRAAALVAADSVAPPPVVTAVPTGQ